MVEPKKERWILNAFGSSKAEIFAVVFATTTSYVLQIFIALFAMVIYNKIVPNNASDTLVTISVGVLLVIVIDFVFKTLKNRIQQNQNRSLELKLSDLLYQKILSWDLQSIPKLPGSSSLLLRDVDTVIQLFGASSINVIVGIPFALIYSIIIFYVADYLAFVTVGAALLSLTVNIIFFKLVENASSAAKEAQVEKSAAFIETLNNIEGVKSLGNYLYFQRKWEKVQHFNAMSADKLNQYLTDASTITAFVTSVSQVFILSLGATAVFEGDITSGALIAAVLMHGRAQQPVQSLMQFLMRYSVAKIGVRRLDRIFNTSSNEEKRRQNLKVTDLSTHIIFKNVEFTVGEVHRSILTIPQISFHPNQKVGILGSVGSGKSTFLKLLAGVLTPTSGSVSFGAYDTSAIDQGALRNSVAYLGQQPSIFSGSIRDNLTLSKLDAREDEIERALELSGFDKILRGFPNGLSFALGEGGRELSGGQKQILALARTLLSDPKVIVLDEPTSAMDPRHELLFIKRMQEFTVGKSLFVVTHRRPILSLVDRVIVIENGKVVMDGERDDVLSKFS